MMPRILRLIIPTLIAILGMQVSSSWSHASEYCSDVDLSGEMGPPRSQGDVGWCYANAAADVLSHYYRKELNYQSVSALHIALLYNQTFYDNEYIPMNVTEAIPEGGYSSIALRFALDHGFCPRSLDIELQTTGEKISLKEKLQKALRIKALYDRKKWPEFHQLLLEIRKTNSVLNHIPRERLYVLLKENSKRRFLKAIADELCGNDKFVPRNRAFVGYGLAFPYLGLNTGLFYQINKQLDQRNPLIVNYYSTFFDSWNPEKKEQDPHASVIVGRKNIKGQCYYKIRNSWGKSCNFKNPDLKKNCRDGHYWISENQFQKYLYAISYIKEP